MSLHRWLRRLSRSWFVVGRSGRRKQSRHAPQPRRPRIQLALEGLEERVVPSTFEVVPAGQANNTTTFATLSAALAVAHNGDTIQIESGSTPGGGTVTQNSLTIQGDPAVGAAGLQTAGTQLGTLTLDGNNDTITDLFLGNVFIGTGKTGETVSNSIINAANVQQIIGSGFTDGGDTITGNTFLGGAAVLGDPTSGSSSANDTITDNVFTNPTIVSAIEAQNETSGLVISGNRITESSSGLSIIAIGVTDSIGVISGNQIQLAANSGNFGILVQDTNSLGIPGNASIAVDNNTVNTSGAGIGIATTRFATNTSFNVSIAGNVLTGNNIGIKLFGNTGGTPADYGNVSIGGSNGAAYSAGGNNLSGYSGSNGNYAILTTDGGKAAANTIIPAEHNLFGVANPQTVVLPDTNTVIDTNNAIIGVQTKAGGTSAIFSNGSAQTLTLSATVTDPLNAADIVNGGTVTFTVKDGNGNIIGNSVSAPVVNGSATANNYSLPAGQAAGSYFIDVSFGDPSLKYGDLGDTSGTLVVNPARVKATIIPATAVFSTAAQTVNLSTTVLDTSHTADTVNEGTVTFTIEDSKGNTIGTGQGTVSGGTASAAVGLPAGQAVGRYIIEVIYSDSNGNFLRFGASTEAFTIDPAKVTTTANVPAPVVFSTATQSVSLSATVADASFPADTVGEGTVTFNIKDILGNSIGTVQGTVSGGKAQATFTVPAGQFAGTYTVAVSYSDSNGNFTDGGDTSSTLTIAPAAVETTANTSTAVFSTQAQTVSLSAKVVDISNSADVVNEGSVTFTIKDSNGNTIGSSPISATVSNGIATVNNYSLPAGAAAGSYTILVSYSDFFGNFADEIDNSNTLTVSPATVKTAANPATAVFSTAGQTVNLTATVSNISHLADTVNEGIVTFTVEDSKGNIIGKTPGNVLGGNVSAAFSLPAGQAAGTYTILVGYTDVLGNFIDSGDTSSTLTVSPASVKTTANPATAVFSTAGQTVNLTATVSDISHLADTVTEGTVTFTVEDSKGNIIGKTPGTVSGTNVSAAFSLPAGQAAGTYTILVGYTDSLGNFVDAGDTSSTLTVSPALVKTTANTAIAVFSTAGQTVNLSATVADTSHTDTVGEGSVTFTVKDILGNTIGTAVPATVSGGSASATFTLPAGQASGTYLIDVSYTDSTGNFTDDGDTSSTLTVSPAKVTTTASTATAIFSTQAQTVSLSATVTDASHGADKVDEGMVTFSLKDSKGDVLNQAQGSVSGGAATASINLSAGQAVGGYTIAVSYTDSLGNFTDGGDTSNTLTVTAAKVTTTASTATAVFSTAGQTVNLTATVSDTSHNADVVNEGSVTFTIEDSNGNTLGSPVSGTVNNGTASAAFTLPAGQAAGSYTIAVSYTDKAGNFTDSGDTSGTLTVSPAKVTTTANASTVAFSTAAQTVSLSATVPDASHGGDVVNEGSVTFTVKDGSGNTIGSPVSGTVNNGAASVAFTLPAGQAIGTYTIAVHYTDDNGNFVDNGDTNSTLTVSTASSFVQLTNVSVTPNLQFFTATETLTAHVSSSGNTVREGTVTFIVAGVPLKTASVDANGDASIQITLPLFSVYNPQAVSVNYNDASNNLTSANNTDTLRWLPINVIFPSNVQVAADGSQTIDLFGSLLTLTYGPQGLLTAVRFEGIQFDFFYNNFSELTQVTQNGTTVLHLFYGPQGQPLSGPSLVGVV